MAESLTPWMARSVCHGLLETNERAINDHKKHLQLDEDDEIAEENDDVTSFQRGSKVQIVRFLGFGGTNAYQDWQKENIPLWAIVADRTHWTCVKFSKDCVNSFDRMHTRKLITMRGSIIALRWYRPGASIQADRLYSIEANSRGGGPFAAALQSDASTSQTETVLGGTPRLVLYVESIQLWGSINESIFWETDDLQRFLLEDENQSKESVGDVGKGTNSNLMMDKEHKSAFKKWIGLIRRQYSRAYTKKHQKSKATIQSASTLSSNQFTTGSEFSGPKPYQQPKELKRNERQADEQTLDARAKKRKMVERADWESSSLSWSEDHYGLQAAADTLLEQRDGQDAKETETDFSDPFALSTSANSNEPSSLEVVAVIQPTKSEIPKVNSEEKAKEGQNISSKQEYSASKSPASEKGDQISRKEEQNLPRSADINWTDLLNLADE